MADTLALLFPNVAVTGDLTVRVAVSFLPEQSAPEQTVQLMERYWRIVDGRGNVHEVRGQGVVGEMPVITPGDSFDYVSGCPLDTPAGAMQGHYIFIDEEGERVTANIPEFALLSPLEPGPRT